MHKTTIRILVSAMMDNNGYSEVPESPMGQNTSVATYPDLFYVVAT